jgi:hypothetical protein
MYFLMIIIAACAGAASVFASKPRRLLWAFVTAAMMVVAGAFLFSMGVSAGPDANVGAPISVRIMMASILVLLGFSTSLGLLIGWLLSEKLPSLAVFLLGAIGSYVVVIGFFYWTIRATT